MDSPRLTSPERRPEELFEQAEASFRRLRSQFEAGKISAEQFKQYVEASPIEHIGFYWMIGVRSGRWYRYDGTTWDEADPPVQRASPSEIRNDHPLHPASPKHVESKDRQPSDRNVVKGIVYTGVALAFALLLGRDFGVYAPEGRLVGDVLIAASAAMSAAGAFGDQELKPQSAQNLIRAIFASGLLLFVTHIST